MKQPLRPVTTHIDPALYDAILAAKKAKKIGTLREFFADALKAALPRRKNLKKGTESTTDRLKAGSLGKAGCIDLRKLK